MGKGWIEKVSRRDVAIVVLAVVLAGLVFFNFDAVNQRTQTINTQLTQLEECNNQKQGCQQQLGNCNTSLSNYIQLYSQTASDLRNCNAASLNAINPPYTYVEGRKVHTVFKLTNGELSSWETPIDTYSYFTTLEYFMNNNEIATLQQLAPWVLERYTKYGNQKYLLLAPQGEIRTTITVLDYRPYIETESIKPIAEDLSKRSISDEAFINEVFNLVKQITVYTTEQEAHFPLTTLLSAGGDCKNTTILTASLLKAAHANWTVKIVYLDADNPENPKKIDHTIVWVDTSKYQTFIETTSKNEISLYEKVVGYYFTV